jgi:hypothetical protein
VARLIIHGRQAAGRTGEPDTGPTAVRDPGSPAVIDDQQYADGEGHRLHVPGARPAAAGPDTHAVGRVAVPPVGDDAARTEPVPSSDAATTPVPVEQKVIDPDAPERSPEGPSDQTGGPSDQPGGPSDQTGGPSAQTGGPRDQPGGPAADKRPAPAEPVIAEPAAPVRRARTSLGAVLALILGLSATYAALTGRLAPVALALGILGLLFGGAGLATTVKPHIAGRGITVLGLVLSFAGIVLALLAFTGVVSWLDGGVDEVSKAREWLDGQLPWLASWR